MRIEAYPKRAGLCPEVLSRFSTAPIFNLIQTVRPRYAAETLGEIKHRLSRESTVLVTGFGLGIMEKIFQMHYPDPTSSPTFCRTLSGQNYYINIQDE
jgi:hypothetical protein